mmetsp:Transcript_39574/g.60490  ORF Transcript_39574/g.60490 Transcript_39574/m.60490 type:complete len:123 (+) Transcript_39574:2242-2610(+)
MMSKMKMQKGWATDYISNKTCKIKVRAVGLDYKICNWLEKNARGLKDCVDLVLAQTTEKLPPARVDNAKQFVFNFFDCLHEHKTSRKIIQLIKDYASCLGPRRMGSNILINKFNEKSKSFFN